MGNAFGAVAIACSDSTHVPLSLGIDCSVIGEVDFDFFFVGL
jgi:hypothetical protein